MKKSNSLPEDIQSKAAKSRLAVTQRMSGITQYGILCAGAVGGFAGSLKTFVDRNAQHKEADAIYDELQARNNAITPEETATLETLERERAQGSMTADEAITVYKRLYADAQRDIEERSENNRRAAAQEVWGDDGKFLPLFAKQMRHAAIGGLGAGAIAALGAAGLMASRRKKGIYKGSCIQIEFTRAHGEIDYISKILLDDKASEVTILATSKDRGERLKFYLPHSEVIISPRLLVCKNPEPREVLRILEEGGFIRHDERDALDLLVQDIQHKAASQKNPSPAR